MLFATFLRTQDDGTQKVVGYVKLAGDKLDISAGLRPGLRLMLDDLDQDDPEALEAWVRSLPEKFDGGYLRVKVVDGPLAMGRSYEGHCGLPDVHGGSRPKEECAIAAAPTVDDFVMEEHHGKKFKELGKLAGEIMGGWGGEDRKSVALGAMAVFLDHPTGKRLVVGREKGEFIAVALMEDPPEGSQDPFAYLHFIATKRSGGYGTRVLKKLVETAVSNGWGVKGEALPTATTFYEMFGAQGVFNPVTGFIEFTITQDQLKAVYASLQAAKRAKAVTWEDLEGAEPADGVLAANHKMLEKLADLLRKLQQRGWVEDET